MYELILMFSFGQFSFLNNKSYKYKSIYKSIKFLKCAILLFSKVRNKEVLNFFSSDKSNYSDVKTDNTILIIRK